MLFYHNEDLIPIGYKDSYFQSDLNFRKSTSGYVFTLGGGAKSWRSVKQSCIVDSTMEAEYVAAYEVAKGSCLAQKIPFSFWCWENGASSNHFVLWQ